MTLQQLVGIELPIIQAPMAGVQGSELAIAVSNAGGLGSLPAAMLGADLLREELTAIRSQTNKPVNVNFFCHTPAKPDLDTEAIWRDTLSPYYHEYDLGLDSIPVAPGREPFSAEAADVLEEFKPAVVSFHFGLPSDELLQRVKSWGSRVISSATTVEEAQWLESCGVDAVIAQGIEAGGHRGMFLSEDLTTQVGTMALLPQIVHAVSVPVIAAGGIANAEGVKAAMTLGAAGVQLGTAYLLCPEVNISDVYRAALKNKSRSGHTAVTNVFTGRPARGIMNRVIKEIGPISPLAPQFPGAATAILPLRAKAESEGSGDFFLHVVWPECQCLQRDPRG